MDNKIKYVVAGLVALLLIALFFSQANATVIPQVEECGTESTFTKEGDYDSSKVNINFQDSDEAITVTVKEGYNLVKVELNVKDDNQAGFTTHNVVSGVKYNPNPGEDIEVAKVTVVKACTPVCTDPEATNEGEVVVGKTVGDDSVCTYPEPKEEETPVATPSAVPTITKLPETGFDAKFLGFMALTFGLGAGSALLWELRDLKKKTK